jgi:hypothetical protein
MADPALALQGAINLKLRADVAGIAGRIFDRVPPSAAMPYVELGEFQTIDNGAQCLEAFEIYATLHVWSRPGNAADAGQVPGKTIASAVHSALHEADLDLGASWQFLEIAHQNTRHLKDPDGVTSQSVMTFRALVAAA